MLKSISNIYYLLRVILFPLKKFATGKRPPSKKEFLLNIEEKENDPDFSGDMEALLRPGITYNQEAAFEWLKNELIEKI